jgi:pantoate--beta-alanine ligase
LSARIPKPERHLKVITSIKELQEYLFPYRKKGDKIGFIPTMGALHDGHLSLVVQAQEKCQVTVVSIFVNPTQFNSPQDLIKYPRNLEADTALLEKIGCDYLFAPSVEEVYPPNYSIPKMELGELDKVMEGEFRPGHFEGVVEVVYRLFDIVKPDFAFFGKKDFQQLTVINHMTKSLKLPVEIVGCFTSRDDTGLARSSRNMRLSESERNDALIIYKTLLYAKELAKESNPSDVKAKAIDFFQKGSLKLEYIEIVDPETLNPLTTSWSKGATACIASYCGEVRLIDNLELIPVLELENR